MNILVLATSFPANEKDISGKFIKDQIQNLKFYHNDFSFHILVGNRSKHSFKNESKDYILHKFRYFIKKLEIIGNEDIKAVSYTHLTLRTICSVWVSVVGG